MGVSVRGRMLPPALRPSQLSSRSTAVAMAMREEGSPSPPVMLGASIPPHGRGHAAGPLLKY